MVGVGSAERRRQRRAYHAHARISTANTAHSLFHPILNGFDVESVPSVIESPSATIEYASAGAFISSASRKYHDVVLSGKTASLSSPPCDPAPGMVRYEVCIAFACQVIGPLAPGI